MDVVIQLPSCNCVWADKCSLYNGYKWCMAINLLFPKIIISTRQMMFMHEILWFPGVIMFPYAEYLCGINKLIRSLFLPCILNHMHMTITSIWCFLHIDMPYNISTAGKLKECTNYENRKSQFLLVIAMYMLPYHLLQSYHVPLQFKI